MNAKFILQKKFTKHQSVNRKVHSNETLNIFITDTILGSIDRKEATALVLLAFFRKLRSFSFSRFAMGWFEIYLSDRNQCVRI